MAKGKHLGEFEILVLAAVLHLGQDAYGMRVRQEIEDQTGRDVAIGAVYATLERLVSKGLLTSSVGEPRQHRGGRAPRIYRAEPEGERALRQSVEAMIRMTSGLVADWGIA